MLPTTPVDEEPPTRVPLHFIKDPLPHNQCYLKNFFASTRQSCNRYFNHYNLFKYKRERTLRNFNFIKTQIGLHKTDTTTSKKFFFFVLSELSTSIRGSVHSVFLRCIFIIYRINRILPQHHRSSLHQTRWRAEEFSAFRSKHDRWRLKQIISVTLINYLSTSFILRNVFFRFLFCYVLHTESYTFLRTYTTNTSGPYIITNW